MTTPATITLTFDREAFKQFLVSIAGTIVHLEALFEQAEVQAILDELQDEQQAADEAMAALQSEP